MRGVNGKLVDLKTSSFEEVPDWEEAARNIALTKYNEVSSKSTSRLPCLAWLSPGLSSTEI
ncbi:hypothetical protein M433DRAFT_159383 [Acidomyces richmondensis BFW]|nr:hypothetical protein M433DRAFT_160861 [Acidomyces richmondensis BFW]KYG41155.1 hypothetical protein M433DRAFT_159383 [Acidomyces richmondensis BFW]